MLAHDIDQAEPLAPERFSTVVETFAQYLLDVVGDFRGFCATGVAVRGADGFGQLVNKGVLGWGEEASGGFGFCRLCLRGRSASVHFLGLGKARRARPAR